MSGSLQITNRKEGLHEEELVIVGELVLSPGKLLSICPLNGKEGHLGHDDERRHDESLSPKPSLAGRQASITPKRTPKT